MVSLWVRGGTLCIATTWPVRQAMAGCVGTNYTCRHAIHSAAHQTVINRHTDSSVHSDYGLVDLVENTRTGEKTHSAELALPIRWNRCEQRA